MKFLLNGQPVEAVGINENTTLLDWLRESGNTETKRSCEEGSCGICSVLIKQADEKFKSVPSCCLTLSALENAQIINGKGIENSKFGAELSEVFAKNYASQCGFCTTGFAIQNCTKSEKTAKDPAEHLRGTLCRCTGYRPGFKLHEFALPSA